jgi:sporulation protein YlmC with PRC-barrel domain
MDDATASRAQIRASDVKGSDVYNAEGEHLGHIDDIVLDKADGKATTAIMSFGGFLGIGERFHPLPWQTLHYDAARNGYVVNVSREQLEGAPHFGAGEEPDWNDRKYDERILTHYGIPPFV